MRVLLWLGTIAALMVSFAVGRYSKHDLVALPPVVTEAIPLHWKMEYSLRDVNGQTVREERRESDSRFPVFSLNADFGELRMNYALIVDPENQNIMMDATEMPVFKSRIPALLK